MFTTTILKVCESIAFIGDMEGRVKIISRSDSDSIPDEEIRLSLPLRRKEDVPEDVTLALHGYNGEHVMAAYSKEHECWCVVIDEQFEIEVYNSF